MHSFEVWLPIGAIGLYLFDSVLMLYSNEVLFLRQASRWGFVMSSSLLLGGRRLCLVNPLIPAIPHFQVHWSEQDTRQEQESEHELSSFLAALRPLQYLVSALWLLLVALPVDLFLFGTGPELLALMGAFYGVILAALGYTYARRAVLRLSVRSFLALSFDALACAPFSINLVRKLALRRSLAGNPIDFARRRFDPATFAALIAAVSGRVSDEQQREFGQTPRWLELESYRQALAAMVNPPGRPESAVDQPGPP
jgi:hypothetical protein